MAADTSELDQKLMLQFSASRNVVEHQCGQRISILLELHGDASRRRVAIVNDRNAHPHLDTRGAHTRFRCKRCNRKVRSGVANTSDQMDLSDMLSFFQIGEQFANLRGARELPVSIVADKINEKSLAILC